MPQGQTQRFGPRVYGTWAVFLTASGRARRLRVDCGDLVTGIDKRIQNRHREIRRSHKDHTHQIPPLLVEFLRFAQQHIPLDLAEPVKIHPARQMVDLMLDRRGPKSDKILAL